MNDLTVHLTSTNTDFNPNILEHDAITSDNDYINIYNNQKAQAYHKFWFLLEDLRYINIYFNKNYNNVRFAFNNKTDKNIKFIKYIKDMSEQIASNFRKIYTSEVVIHYPWKEKENEYPYTILFLSNSTSIMCDSNSQPIANCVFDTESTYSMIFEIANIAITKDIINNAMTYNLKYKPFIKIVKKEPPINFLSFSKNGLDLPSNGLPYMQKPLQQFINQSPQITTSEPSFNTQAQSTKQSAPIVSRPQICLDPKTLLNMKQALRKTVSDTVNEQLPVDDGTKKDFLDVKSNLKNVVVEEKTLMTHLINEHKMKVKETEQQAINATVVELEPVVVKKKKSKKTTG